MKLAELLKDSEPQKAKEYLKKAQEVAQSDEKLVIRKRQIAKLADSFK